MKQPDLGRKISELRKAKGLTQEELVEKCNVSVRTLQRIETGEVTPRSYTIKTILAALDYELNIIEEDDNTHIRSISEWLKKYILLDINFVESSAFFIRHLNLAWIMGICYFIIEFFNAASEYFRYEYDELIFGTNIYIIIKLCSLITYLFFLRGFIIIGGLYKNYLLRIASFILIFGYFLIIGYDIASIFYDSVEWQFILGSEAIVFGCIGILFGISLRRLQNSVGTAATWAGNFEIISGLFFLSIVLSFVGFITLIPSELCEIIVIYKCIDIIKTKQEVSSTPTN